MSTHTNARKLNILFVSEFFYPRKAGGEIWAWELCKELARRGHDVTVITCRYGGLTEEETASGVHILRPVLTADNRPVRRIATMRLARYVKKYVMRNKETIDLIHVPAYTMDVAVSRIAKRNGIPCITSVHSYFGDQWKQVSIFWPFLRWLERRVLIADRSTAMQVPSTYLQERIRKDVRKETTVVHNWLPDTLPKAKKLSGKTFLFVGSLERIKNPLACIDIAKRHDAKLIVIGEGSLRAKIERGAKEAGIHCTLLGNLPYDETLSYIGGATAVLVPSITESFSLVALEAAAQGTPVIGNPVGILPELPGVESPESKRMPKRIPHATQLRIRRQYAKTTIIPAIEELYRRLV